MNSEKRKRLEEAGWKVGTADDFLGDPAARRVQITFIDRAFGEVKTTVDAESVPATIAKLDARDFSIEAVALLGEGE